MAGPDENAPERDPADPPAASAAEEQLEKLLAAKIRRYQSSASKYGRTTYASKLVVIVLGLCITLLLGLKNFSGEAGAVFSNVALACGVAVTALTTWEEFANYRKLWIRFSETASLLEEQRRLLDYLKAGGMGGLTPQKLDEMFATIQQIINQTDQGWKDMREPRGGQAKGLLASAGGNRSETAKDHNGGNVP